MSAMLVQLLFSAGLVDFVAMHLPSLAAFAVVVILWPTTIVFIIDFLLIRYTGRGLAVVARFINWWLARYF